MGPRGQQEGLLPKLVRQPVRCHPFASSGCHKARSDAPGAWPEGKLGEPQTGIGHIWWSRSVGQVSQVVSSGVWGLLRAWGKTPPLTGPQLPPPPRPPPNRKDGAGGGAELGAVSTSAATRPGSTRRWVGPAPGAGPQARLSGHRPASRGPRIGPPSRGGGGASAGPAPSEPPAPPAAPPGPSASGAAERAWGAGPRGTAHPDGEGLGWGGR
ncbi:collagen alpha-1(I) chain-like [Prionailurus viverrinus]|uniref:collagen alpha-1(I) chain-like n=1 Tax=Prionailurus viverrinus TaxID=61388 RepID=UPI001FF6B6F8|nr:collagen alpha-1(I) chain-like [Prionailurus viverrinus]